MPIFVESLTELPLKEFFRLQKTTGISKLDKEEYVYLIAPPIRGLNPERSKNKIAIGDRCTLSYLNSVSYHIGYTIETNHVSNMMYPTHLLLGTIPNNSLLLTGEISTLYKDGNLSILQHKQSSTYLILPAYTNTIPQPTI